MPSERAAKARPAPPDPPTPPKPSQAKGVPKAAPGRTWVYAGHVADA